MTNRPDPPPSAATGDSGETGAVLAALADPTRRQVVALLAERGAATATSLARELPVTRQAVVQHLAVLKQAGVVRSEKSGRDVLFELEPASLTGAARWMDAVAARWDQRLATLKAMVEHDARETAG
ncbi:ArsR family transcriptional regulator [Kribbella amoyensis]|uniref:ArsR family transcriptional regulator n=1 Tax=Kribbella amoyensis TaxID=996641 RepID=A0A561BV93_9ACTN|nr:metalloregulator ArsR/SmtB family transcription factor [Kribbella amoyensis]TWD82741.1 ArsR family transcriptional regulator [Kribbella amoyensis]